MNFNFGEVLTRAWQIIWKNKILWIFGILASCARGNAGGAGGGGGNSGYRFESGQRPPFADEHLASLRPKFSYWPCIFCYLYSNNPLRNTHGRHRFPMPHSADLYSYPVVVGCHGHFGTDQRRDRN